MRTAIAVTLVAVALGFGAGWFARGTPEPVVRYDERPALRQPLVAKVETPFPDKPKPPLIPPTPVPTPIDTVTKGDPNVPAPPSMIGRLPSAALEELPPAFGEAIVPLTPTPPQETLPADLAADEARARRIVLQNGGTVVSGADARDGAGKVGRTLVVETRATGRDRVRKALRAAFGGRIVLSDAGASPGSSPEIRKAEDELTTLRKQRDQARIDFLPNAPTLIDLEESTLKAERQLADLRRAAGRQRLNLMLRPAADL